MPGTWASLVTHDQVGKVTLFFEYCVSESFKTDQVPVRHVTEAEIKRRFEVIARIFEQLRGDLKWSLERIFDLMPRYVRLELDGENWAPEPERRVWIPNQS